MRFATRAASWESWIPLTTFQTYFPMPWTHEKVVRHILYRAADQQSTMGTFVGRTTIKDGLGAMKDWRYGDGTTYLPSEEEARKMRPGEG